MSRWTYVTNGAITSAAVGYYGDVYIVDTAHEFHDLLPGAAYSNFEQLGGLGTPLSSPAVGNGGVYGGSDDGKLYFRRAFGRDGNNNNGAARRLRLEEKRRGLGDRLNP